MIDRRLTIFFGCNLVPFKEHLQFSSRDGEHPMITFRPDPHFTASSLAHRHHLCQLTSRHVFSSRRTRLQHLLTESLRLACHLEAPTDRAWPGIDIKFVRNKPLTLLSRVIRPSVIQ